MALRCRATFGFGIGRSVYLLPLPAGSAAITQFGLTAHIADSVVEALRARARRQVNLQRRQTKAPKTKAVFTQKVLPVPA